MNPFKNFQSQLHVPLEFTWENEFVRLLGLNSVNPYSIKDGFLATESLEKIKQTFYQRDNKVNLLMFHHNFDRIPYMHKPLTNHAQLEATLLESTVDVICTGHLHVAHPCLVNKANDVHWLLLHAGSLSCRRTYYNHNSYYIIDISPSCICVETKTYSAPSFITTHVETYPR